MYNFVFKINIVVGESQSFAAPKAGVQSKISKLSERFINAVFYRFDLIRGRKLSFFLRQIFGHGYILARVALGIIIDYRVFKHLVQDLQT